VQFVHLLLGYISCYKPSPRDANHSYMNPLKLLTGN